MCTVFSEIWPTVDIFIWRKCMTTNLLHMSINPAHIMFSMDTLQITYLLTLWPFLIASTVTLYAPNEVATRLISENSAWKEKATLYKTEWQWRGRKKNRGRKIGREIYVVNILIMLQNKTDWLSYNESHFRNNNVLTCMGCVESENENYGRFFLFQIPHLLFSRCSNFYHLPRFLRNLCAFSPKVHRSNFPFSLGSAGCWRTLTGAAHL